MSDRPAASTRALGADAERRVAEWLTQHYGYKILVRNYRCRHGEIDLIAEEAGVLCFVEVRTRRTDRWGTALETIDRAKRRRIALAAHQFVVTQGMESRACRFDVVTIQGGPGGGGSPQLLKDAFDIDE